MNAFPQRRKRTTGVTILEVMVVLAIMALIAGLAGPRVVDTFGRAKSRTAEVEMEGLKSAIQLFYIDVGRYPSEAEGLNVLLSEPAGVTDWRGPYLESEEDLMDPWGRAYLFRSPGKEKAFDLYTYGRDGHLGGSKEDSDINL